jgi:S-DNA-T family DNA segregation ATPase FtsK/SpoIIIE
VYSLQQFVRHVQQRALWRGTLTFASTRVLVAIAFLVAALAWAPRAARALDEPPPAGTIGRVSGYDISVEAGATAPIDTANNAPAIYVSNGSVVTVHSGTAHMTLTSGGQVDICGPAKFTMLVSGGSITLALNFGRVHVLLPSATQLRIFTPTIVATPIDISGNQRDITAGLDLNDSLCVRATSGALRLEQQFTGQDLIVPEAGEFFLAEGKLVPVAGTPGGCDCALMVAKKSAPPPVIPVLGITGHPTAAPEAPEVASNSSAANNIPVEQQNVTLHALPLNNDAHPVVAQQTKSAEPPKPLAPSEVPDYKIIAPPLAFSAKEPQAPQDTSNDVALLVRTVHVEPEWQFSGHVQPPGSSSFTNAPTVKTVSVSKPAATPPANPLPSNPTPAAVAPVVAAAPTNDATISASAAPSAQPVSTTPQRKSGFWSRLKRAFSGS